MIPSTASTDPHAIQARLSRWQHKAPKIGVEGNALLKMLKQQPMTRVAILRLPQRAQLGPLIHPNGFVMATKDNHYAVTPAGTAYLTKLRNAGFIE